MKFDDMTNSEIQLAEKLKGKSRMEQDEILGGIEDAKV